MSRETGNHFHWWVYDIEAGIFVCLECGETYVPKKGEDSENLYRRD